MLLNKFDTKDKGNELINKTKNSNILVLYYAEWCGHCQTFKPQWKSIYTYLLKHKLCEVAEVEHSNLDNVGELKNHAQGFPTIILYKKNNKELLTKKKNTLSNLFSNININNENKLPSNAIKYEEPRTFKDIIKFIKKHTSNKTTNKKSNIKPKKQPVKKYKSKKTGGKRLKTPNRKTPKTLKTLKHKTPNKNVKYNTNNNEEYYPKKELIQIKKDRLKSKSITNKLKNELSKQFKL
jgi:thiol-disulfide isomerase/thioredoxin